MLHITFVFAVVLLFIYTWAALNKPRQHAGTPNERLFFTWHAVQLLMVALFLLSGRLSTGCTFNEALHLFSNPQLFWSILISAALYIVLFRLFPVWVPEVPGWFNITEAKELRAYYAKTETKPSTKIRPIKKFPVWLTQPDKVYLDKGPWEEYADFEKWLYEQMGESDELEKEYNKTSNYFQASLYGVFSRLFVPEPTGEK
jgi:hypothetical protein